MNEAELYKELGALTKNKEKWEESIAFPLRLQRAEGCAVFLSERHDQRLQEIRRGDKRRSS